MLLLSVTLGSVAQNCWEWKCWLGECSGFLRLGLMDSDGNSLWLPEGKSAKSDVSFDAIKRNPGKRTVFLSETLKTKLGNVEIEVVALSDTRGYSFCLKPSNLKPGVRLVWAYGGASCEAYTPNATLTPERCADNVFSMEDPTVCLYYGTSRALRVVTLVMPRSSAPYALKDGLKLQSPEILLNSTKKTVAPVMANSVALENDKELYFSIFKQNAKADYNVFMLKELHDKGSYKTGDGQEWMDGAPN